MALQVIPEWIVNLDDEDVSFIKTSLKIVSLTILPSLEAFSLVVS